MSFPVLLAVKEKQTGIEEKKNSKKLPFLLLLAKTAVMATSLCVAGRTLWEMEQYPTSGFLPRVRARALRATSF